MSAAPPSVDVAPATLARRLLTLVDLTSLNESDDAASIVRLAALASTDAGRVAAFCTWPRLLAVARQALHGSGVALAAVVNFPHGTAAIETVTAETAAAIQAGAGEIDLVFPYREFLAGRPQVGLELVRACRRICGQQALLKVILETGQLASADHIRRAADLAIEAGAQFLKTSTGKTTPGATPEAAAVLLDAIAAAHRQGVTIGCKVSGGIRTLQQARCYLELYESRLGAGSARPSNFRIGASTLLQELLAIARGQGA